MVTTTGGASSRKAVPAARIALPEVVRSRRSASGVSLISRRMKLLAGRGSWRAFRS